MRYAAVGLLLVASAGRAQTFTDWSVDDIPSDRAVFAATINESGGLLGKSCSTDGCRWIVTLKAKCESGSRYPALLNADAAAWPITLVCAPNDKNPGRYIIAEYDSVDKAVQTGEVIGLAMPMQDGLFRVSRYSLKGWFAASQRLRERAADLMRKPGESTL